MLRTVYREIKWLGPVDANVPITLQAQSRI